MHHISAGAAQPLQEADFPIQMLQMISAKAVARHGAPVVSKAPVLSSVSYFNVACGGSSYTSDNNRASQMRKTHISESKQCEQGRLQSSVYLNRGSASSVACSVHRYEIPRIIFNTFQQSTGKRICPLTAQTHVDVAKNVWLSPVLVTAL